MNRRSLWIIVIGAALLGAGFITLRWMASTDPAPTASPGPPASPARSAVAVVAPSLTASVAAGSPPASLAATPTCAQIAQLVAVRAVAPDTGFPVKVVWTDLGPSDDLFVTLSDVSPTIPITPPGPAALTVGLAYATGADNFALTAGALGLVYDPATGTVSGDLATGYGENSNRASTEPQPSQFVGKLTRPAGGANGSLVGAITHAGRRDYVFRVAMTEKTIQVASGPGCPSTRPTDAP